MRPTLVRAVAYVRVSTDKQAESGVSLDEQRAKIAAYAALYGLDVIDVVVEGGASAKTLDRPGLSQALSLLRSGKADALVVAKLDRLTRSVRDLGDLVERYFASGKAALLSVSEQVDTRSASGRMVLNLLGSLAQWERETIGERTSAAMRHKVNMGEYVGGAPPYGFRVAADGVQLEPVATEQEVRMEARALRAAGLSFRAVTAQLSAAGARSRSGRPFEPMQIRRMVSAPMGSRASF